MRRVESVTSETAPEGLESVLIGDSCAASVAATHCAAEAGPARHWQRNVQEGIAMSRRGPREGDVTRDAWQTSVPQYAARRLATTSGTRSASHVSAERGQAGVIGVGERRGAFDQADDVVAMADAVMHARGPKRIRWPRVGQRNEEREGYEDAEQQHGDDAAAARGQGRVGYSDWL